MVFVLSLLLPLLLFYRGLEEKALCNCCISWVASSIFFLRGVILIIEQFFCADFRSVVEPISLSRHCVEKLIDVCLFFVFLLLFFCCCFFFFFFFFFFVVLFFCFSGLII